MISVQADAKTKVSVGAGKVVGGTNAAAGIYANINYKCTRELRTNVVITFQISKALR